MTFWQDRPVLVTGATGQVGGWVTKQLLSVGAEVVCLVRDWVPQCQLVREMLINKVKLVRGNLLDFELLKRMLSEYEVSSVIHLAGQSIVGTAIRDPLSTFDTNIRGTWCLLEACRQTSTVKQIVVASTDKVYGESEALPYSEEMPMLATYPHDVSKACAEMVASSYAKTYRLNIAITRLANIYGGGDLNWNRIVPGTIRSILRGEQPVIQSNGKFIRDYLYVEEAARAQLLLAERLAEKPEVSGQAFNISNECPMTVIELVERILKLMESSMQPKVIGQSNHEIKDQYMSAVKAKEKLGWEPMISIDEGLVRTIEWYRAFLNQGEEG